MRKTRHSFTWANSERRSTKIRRRSPRFSDDGASWSPQRVMSCPLGPRRRDSSGAVRRRRQVPQYKYREYTISISTMRVDDAIKVDTDIFLSPDATTGFGNRLRAGTTQENSSPEEDDRLQAAIDAWNDVNAQIEEFIAENVGRR